MLKTLLTVLAAAALSAAPARAGLLTFDDLAPSQGDLNPFLPSPFAYGGFTFSSSYLFLISSPGGCGFGGCSSDGTPHLASSDGPALVVMSPAGGGTFALTSFAGALGFNNTINSAVSPDRISVTGQQAGGGSVQASFAVSSTFSTFTLPTGFTGLMSVAFQGIFQPGGTVMQTGANGIALDDILANGATGPIGAVPEPASLLILGAGLLGVTVWRCRVPAGTRSCH